ncbi:hypothetical protein ACFYSC_24405 [Streptosporangium sp. NPDC004379]|uniref:hypothetical protein n=1 Tax=Streptosporangium sp. NPDC004379 TaxID=3366189 RepID=UPI0036A16335
MEISVKFPLDSDGFLRRECPNCEQQFKWHYGPANEEAEKQTPPVVYYCPLCGRPAGLDEWWTQEQLDYSHGFAEPAAIRFALDELTSVFKRNKYIKIKPNNVGLPEVPVSLVEPDDMQIVASPCHSYEPVKVPNGLTEPIYCLLCGAPFGV